MKANTRVKLTVEKTLNPHLAKEYVGVLRFDVRVGVEIALHLDGDRILWTSRVQSIDGARLQTRNTTYALTVLDA